MPVGFCAKDNLIDAWYDRVTPTIVVFLGLSSISGLKTSPEN